ncbi:metal-sensitive transcriptional regulator [Chitinilyticum piscinae]|uniref:Metal-sensitive transcriptional regulator n=1 Tax=Chitinilyticum piscinae TaxID=2866724 RepID=A0A8J7FLT2_9NEIS|nr:metal-sensitive transcriptional regulator [Chitinilyticum piscinae]MBE9608686.1 metal-sensitive transcriptional regulator [Chitinilyticum piscinae]
MTSSAKTIRPNKDALIKRVNRINGQVSAVGRMIDEERYSIDILHQVTAARNALDALSLQLLEEHARVSVDAAIGSKKGDAAVEEVLKVVRQLVK